MMPPVPANQHPMNHPQSRQQQEQHQQHQQQQQRRRAEAGNSEGKQLSSDAMMMPPPPNTNKPAVMGEDTTTRVTAPTTTNNNTSDNTSTTAPVVKRRTMDPPAALDPAELLAELHMCDDDDDDDDDHNNIDYSYHMNHSNSSSNKKALHDYLINNNNNSGPMSNGGSGSGSGSHAMSGSGSGVGVAPQQPTMTVPAKQQLGLLRSKYFQPKSKTNSGGSNSVSRGNYSQSSRGSGLMLRGSERTLATASMTISDVSSGGVGAAGGGSAGEVSHSIGTYTIPTFKGSGSSGGTTKNNNNNGGGGIDTSARDRRRTNTRSKLKAGYRRERGDDILNDEQQQRLSSISTPGLRTSGRLSGRSYTSTNTSGRRSYASTSTNPNNNHKQQMKTASKPKQEMFSLDMDSGAESGDDWMEEALLNGITSANKGNDIDNYGNNNNNHVMDDVTKYSKHQLLDQLLDTSDIGDPLSHSEASTQQRHQRLLSRGQFDITASSNNKTKGLNEEEILNSRRRSRSVKFQRGRSAGSGFADELVAEQLLLAAAAGQQRQQQRRHSSKDDDLDRILDGSNDKATEEGEPRRISIADLTNPNISMDDLLKTCKTSSSAVGSRTKTKSSTSSSSRPSSGSHSPHLNNDKDGTATQKSNDNDVTTSEGDEGDDDALSNIPILPTIQTYKVTKTHPSEPAGLFLTKAKNGAVLVHSLSPESLFRKSTPLHPGQEVLSVNEKRVNDPKMAATLITQAKRNLSLRISTVERSRGFLYCQVKRRNNASGGAGGGAPASDVAEGGTKAAGVAAGATGVPGRKRTRPLPSGAATPNPSHHGVRFITTSIDGVRRCGLSANNNNSDGSNSNSNNNSGLVRVSHIDPHGLFANSHPMNRLRVGGIVLTVNGEPVTNGRAALERVMGSRQLVEVLHCDERVWREDWVKDGLEQVLRGGGYRMPRSAEDVTSSIFNGRGGVNSNNSKGKDNKDEGQGKGTEGGGSGRSSPSSSDNSLSMWDLEWKPDREEVILRKKKRKRKNKEDDSNAITSSNTPTDYAFKLIFNNDVGTCHPELVDEHTMMPPADEFDVSLLVRMVNDSQRTMMTVLQNMLRRAKHEANKLGSDNKSGSGGVSSSTRVGKQQQSVAASRTSTTTLSSKQLPQDARGSAVASREQQLNDNNEGQQQQQRNDTTTSTTRRRERINSYDVLAELIEDEHGGVNEELCQLADSLLRVDSRDTRSKRNTLRESQLKRQGLGGGGGGATGGLLAGVDGASATTVPRRGSTGFVEAISGLSPADIEQWKLERWENQPTTGTTTTTNLREFSARQHRMEEQYNQHSRAMNRATGMTGGVGGDHHTTSKQQSTASLAGSMFSTDMLEDFLDYLEDVSANQDSVSTPNTSQGEGDAEGSGAESPPSPRDEANKWEEALRISPTHESSEDENLHRGGGNDNDGNDHQQQSPPERKGDDDMAYITGVWRDVASKYEISDKVVGSGGFGEVRDCYDKKTGQIYVVKTIFKPEQSDTTKINLIRNEILLLHEAHHPNIVELRDLFEDDKYVHIVMERCTGGDLFDRVVNENPRRLRNPAEAMKHEARTASSMRSILHVLKYLHSKGIVHRDIKPEHFLLTTEERETQKIKLIDFGLARKHKPGSAPMTTFTGSPSFVAPEVIARRYDHMCDMFSVGVTAYFLLTGMLPFDGPTDEETFDLISDGRFKFPSSSVFLSDDAKDFITRLLKVDPNKRMSAGKALNHPWLLRAASC